MTETALITGAGKRIGKAIALHLAENGYKVALHCNRSRRDAEEVQRTIEQMGGTAAVVQADLSDHKATATIVPKALETLGPLTLLVNNASVFEADDIRSMTERSWRFHQSVNIEAPVFLSQDFAEQLPDDRKGNIVNIIDQRVLKLTPEFFSYQLAKSALWIATRTMAQALAPQIRVNGISPGPTIQNARQRPEDFQAQLDGILLKKGAELEEFGHTIRYLVETPSITGQMICLDGGQHLAWETPDIAGIPE